MKKLVTAVLLFAASSAAFAETWSCVCTQQDDFGACVAWTCTKGDYPGVDPTSFAGPKTPDEKLLESVISKTDAKAQELSISAK